MTKKYYTLKEISADFDISIKALRDHIHKGTLGASKVGRSYLVKSEDLDKFIDATNKFPVRNFLCERYETCLNEAALLNKSLDCERCPRLSYSKDRYEILLAPYHSQSSYKRKSIC